MTNPDNVDKLDFQILRREMNHLIWIDGFMNRDVYDMGWGCRDHAWLLSAVMSAHEIEHRIATGKALFVQGQRGDQPPVGLGNTVTEDGIIEKEDPSHTWLVTESRGFYDISPDLTIRRGQWRPLDFDGVVESEWIPLGEGSILECTSRRDFKDMVARGSHQKEKSYGFYWPRRIEKPAEAMYERPFRWIDSPQTARLSNSYDADLYKKIAVHLLGLLVGKRTSLTSISRGRALSVIDRECSSVTPV